MPTLPVRKLGAIGVITDANPYTLPLNAFSSANNVLFDEGRAQRAPVFKKLYEAMRILQQYDSSADTYATVTGTYQNTLGAISVNQRFISSYHSTTQEAVIVCDTTGTVREYPQGVMNDITPTGGGLITNSNPWSHAQVAGVSVLARRGMRPYLRNLQTESVYNVMRGDWVTTDTAAVVRPFGDFIVFLNMNKNGTQYQTMVKWCHPLQFSPDPVTGIIWNPADTTKLAGENVLGEMRTPIRDGLPLGNLFIIYSQDQVWKMEFTEGSAVFNFSKCFQSGGILNANCVVEVESTHFVLGEEDIYRHDGITKRTVADERVRKYIYGNMDRNKREAFFVHHDSVLNLIYFCYVSKEATAGFPNTTFCNKAAVYNYRNDTWTFLDIPNLAGSAETNLTLGQVGYPAASTAETPKVSVMLGVQDSANSLSETRVYAVDNPDNGFVLIAAEPETVKPAVLERIGIDLDAEMQLELRAYKLIKAILPQVTFENTGNLSFQVGSSDQINGPVTWSDPIVFDHVNDYKVDTRQSGRYLAIRIISNTAGFFRLPSFDIEVQKLARR